MDDDVGNEDNSFSQEFSSSHVPHMIMSGNLKDAKEGSHTSVTRFCTVRVTRIGI